MPPRPNRRHIEIPGVGSAETPFTATNYLIQAQNAALMAERDRLRRGPVSPAAAQRILEITQRLKEVASP